MKTSVVLAIIAITVLLLNAVFTFALSSYAQTLEPTIEPTVEVTPVPPPGLPDTPPATAQEGLNMLALLLGTLAGLAGTRLTAFIRDLPFLKDEEKSKLSGLVADLTAFVLSTGIAYLVAFLTPLAQTLDSSGLWQVLLWAWPSAKAWYEIEKHREANVVELTGTVEEVN